MLAVPSSLGRKLTCSDYPFLTTFLDFNAKDLLAEFSITENDLQLIKSFGVVMQPHLSDFLDRFYDRLKDENYFQHFFPDDESVQKVKASQIT
jgi:hypothetical protein